MYSNHFAIVTRNVYNSKLDGKYNLNLRFKSNQIYMCTIYDPYGWQYCNSLCKEKHQHSNCVAKKKKFLSTIKLTLYTYRNPIQPTIGIYYDDFYHSFAILNVFINAILIH